MGSLQRTSGVTPILAVLIAFISTGFATGDDGPGKQSRLLLKDYWKQGSSSRNESQQIFKKAPDATLIDIQFQKAYVLNRVFHLRSREALPILERMTSANGQDFDAWYLRTWIELSNGNFDRGLLSLQSFRKNLDAAAEKAAKNPTTKKTFELRRNIAVRRIGRLLGYVEIVGSSKANDATLEESLLLLTAGLEDADLKALNEQRKKVSDKYAEFQHRAHALQTDEKAKLIEERNREIQQLQKQSDLLAKRGNTLEPKLDAIQARYDDRRTQLESKADPLRSEISQINASVGAMESQLNFMYGDLLITESRALRTRDPILRRRFFQQADLIALAIRDQEVSLNSVYGRANSVAADLGVIQNDLNKERAEYLSQSGVLRKELNGIQKTLRRNTKKMNSLSKDPTVIHGRLVSLNNRAGALKTYDELPLESMRQKLLDKIGE